MPIIGQTNVPPSLWEELLTFSVLHFPLNILEDIGDRYGSIDAPAKKAQVSSILINDYETLCNRLITLIREQTGDYVSSDEAIKRGDNYRNIWSTVWKLGDQIAFDVMFNIEHLKTVAMNHAKAMEANPPSTQ